MSNNLTGKAATVYTADYNAGVALQTLQATLTASIEQAQAAGATTSLAQLQAVQAALAPVAQPLIDSMNAYLEAGNLNGQ